MEETVGSNGRVIQAVKEGKRRGESMGCVIAGGAAWTRGSAGRDGKRRASAVKKPFLGQEGPCGPYA